jgi:hypothetical protein
MCTLSGGNLGTIVGLNGNSSYKISTITKDETFGLSCSFALDSNATYEYLSKINITPVPPYTKANVKVIEKDNLDIYIYYIIQML